MMNHIREGRGLRALPGLLLVGALTLSLAGCNTDEIVEVEDPAQLQPSETNSADAVPALVNGALRQFIGGYSGLGDDSFMSVSALISDEFYYGDSFTTRNAGDRRSMQAPILGNISDTPFLRLHQARMLARRAYAAVNKFEDELADDPDAFRAELRRTEGYVYVALSEGWCGAVPFSNVPDEGEIDPAKIESGQPLTVAQMNQAAIPLFDEAIALAADVTGTRAATVGKGRALLNLGQFANAAAAVANVPTTFVFHLEHSTNTSTQNNGIASLIDNGRYSPSNWEGGQNASGTAFRPDNNNTATAPASAEGLGFRGAQDPRLPYLLTGGCFTSAIFCFTNLNYPDFDADVPLASGVEARLIEAEAALQAGNVDLMLTRLNALRASAASLLPLLYPDRIQGFPASPGVISLAALTDPAAAGATAAEAFAARRNLLFRERAFWLYNTGHRQGDLRRLIRQYGLPQNQVFPTGPYFRGSAYGSDVNYPVPFNEENNPNFVRAGCITTEA
jgi:hypothetical protein